MKASRLLSLPPYLFEELENRYREAVGQGRDVIDLSIGDPDLAPPPSLLSTLTTALERDSHHRYPPQRGDGALKASIRRYLSRRYQVEPSDDEILVLIGSKEGLAHLPWAVCNPGDRVIVPDPGYPVYRSAATFAGCELVTIPLSEADGFLPDLDSLDSLSDRARLLFLNYPNNPTSASASADMLETIVALSRKHGTIVANDAAYADVYTSSTPEPVLCAVPGALDSNVIEFFSFSKQFSITGWRVGFAVGNKALIDALAHLKANIDSGVFNAIQEAVAATLDGDGDAYTVEMRKEYGKRREAAETLLARHGFHCFPSCATFYAWVRLPSDRKAMDFAVDVLDKVNVLITPGVGFGSGGEGYFRIALTQPVEKIKDAIQRLSGL